MLIDSSILVSVLLDEPGWRRYVQAIEADESRLVLSVSLVESSIVLQSRLGEKGDQVLDSLIKRLFIEIVAFTPAMAAEARFAASRFGKGRHPAQLNFGDCMVYAAAKELVEPLLFIGTDFSLTDIEIVQLPKDS